MTKQWQDDNNVDVDDIWEGGVVTIIKKRESSPIVEDDDERERKKTEICCTFMCVYSFKNAYKYIDSRYTYLNDNNYGNGEKNYNYT